MTDTAAAPEGLGFDPDALRERYRRERDKRIDPRGNEQYREVVGDLAAYVEDPYVTGPADRDPVTDEVDVVVVGGGFGGLLAGARLHEAGIDSFRLVEKGGDFGGTWYWNRYPGAQCDIESYVYLPLLEEVGYLPTEKYSHAPEILAHSRRIAEHFDLVDRTLLRTEVTELTWDEADDRWIVSTDLGDAIRARFVIMSSGPLHRPKLPGIPGVETFEGHSFHTSRWDYDYTGGSTEGGLDRLGDKVVGVIGTGATAVQCVPHLGRGAKHLYVFQRTPSSIDVRGNAPTDPDWAASLEPGWHRERMENFNTLVSGGIAEQDLVNDGWTDIIGKLLVVARQDASVVDPERLAATLELVDFEKMNEIRARVDELVEDPDIAEKLKPWYRQFCKRPCFHDDYLPTFNRPNVTLVDTDGKGVDEITPRGIVANGVEYELDCIIYATGFEVGTAYTRRAGLEAKGRDGLTLSAKWADGMSTLHGIHTHGFPNMFFVSHAQGGFTANYPHMLTEVSTHVAHVISEVLGHGATRVEVTESAEREWVDTILTKARNNQEFLEECTPGYYNNEGRPAERGTRDASYGEGSPAYFRLLAEWRDEGTLAGLELR